MGTLIGQALNLESETISESRRGGSAVQRVWTGTYEACVDAGNTLRADENVEDLSVSRLSSGTGIVVAYFSEVENAETEKDYFWEFPPTIRSLDLWQHPKSLNLTPPAPLTYDGWLASLKDMVKAIQSGTALTASQSALLTGSADQDEARKLVLRIAHGGTQYVESTYSLKLSEVVSPRYTVQISDVGVEKLYTSSQIVTEAIANGTPLPDRYIYKLQQIEAAPKTVGLAYYDGAAIGKQEDYFFGWLKFASTERERGDAKIQIDTHWTLALWSTYEYDTYSP